jgi:hypothetical protein
MTRWERRLAQEAKRMTRVEVVKKAFEGAITWQQAADICDLTPRQMLRLRSRYQAFGPEGLRDGRAGRVQPWRIPRETLDEMCRLKREVYPDFSIRHFHQFLTEKHKIRMCYTMTRDILQVRGLVEKAPGRGRYHRKRERRPMRGMLVHLDASKHPWIAGRPHWDLVVALDDADGRILFARFFPEEGIVSTLWALRGVLSRHGRFCELYTDRGSHFCRTADAAEGPDEIQNGHIPRVLKVLGIRSILARSPEARGRSERCFGTLQRRLPQELRLHGIGSYEEANRYLERVFVTDFNRRFAVVPQQPETAFSPIKGLDLDLLLSVQHERQVRNDNTVQFETLALQLQPSRTRAHFVRCPVTVHEFLDDTLGVSFQGQLVGRFDRSGLSLPTARRKAA